MRIGPRTVDEGVKAFKRRAGRSRVVVRLRRRRGQSARLRFYGQFISSGDLVFDVGAHVGNRTAVFLALGARVVAVEPQAECVAELRRSFARNDRLSIVPNALAATEGTQQLFVSDASMLSSLSPEWIEGMQASGRFAGFSWDAGPSIQTLTLDTLIAQHGVPRFCKIDVEGYEEQVLSGLTSAIPMVSLEFQPERLEATQACLDRLQSLGRYEFNLGLNEHEALAHPNWVDAAALRMELERLRGPVTFGDVYARLTEPPRAQAA